jgi:hypothetical protein
MLVVMGLNLLVEAGVEMDNLITHRGLLLEEVDLVVPASSSSHILHKYLKNHNDIYKGHQ